MRKLFVIFALVTAGLQAQVPEGREAVQIGTKSHRVINPVIDFTGVTVTGLSLGLPAQSGHNTQSLVTDGTNASWADRVRSITVTTANGVSASVTNQGTTPTLIFSLGAIIPSSVAATGTVTGSNLSGTNTGDQTIALTGDVTGSGTGSFGATISAGSVTLSKFQNIGTNSIIGRATAGSGSPEILTPNQTKSILSIQESDVLNLITDLTSKLSAISSSNTIDVAVNGNDSTGLRERFDKPFLTIEQAITVAQAGDIIRVSPGTFTPSSPLILPTGVSLIGAGIDITIINSAVPNTTGAVVSAGGSDIVANLTINGTLPANTSYQRPLGCASAATGIVLLNVKVTGDSDALQMNSTATGTFVRAFNCYFSAKIDAAQIQRGTGEFYDCISIVSGGSLGATYASAVSAISTGTNIGKIYWRGGYVSSDGGTSVNSVFEVRGNAAGGFVEASNGVVHLGTTATSNYIFNASVGSISYLNIAKDDGSSLTSTGTVSYLGRSLLKDNNLSDLLNSFSARSYLGVAIGSDVQAHDDDLDSLAALTGTNTIYYRSGPNTWSAITIGTGLAFSSGALSATGGSGLSVTYQSATVSAAGNTAAANTSDLATTYITANTGVGAYTATYSIPTSGRTAGAQNTIHIHYAASANPTIEIHNATSGGTLLFNWTGDGTVTDILAECRYDGAAWYIHDAHFVW